MKMVFLGLLTALLLMVTAFGTKADAQVVVRVGPGYHHPYHRRYYHHRYYGHPYHHHYYHRGYYR